MEQDILDKASEVEESSYNNLRDLTDRFRKIDSDNDLVITTYKADSIKNKDIDNIDVIIPVNKRNINLEILKHRQPSCVPKYKTAKVFEIGTGINKEILGEGINNLELAIFGDRSKINGNTECSTVDLNKNFLLKNKNANRIAKCIFDNKKPMSATELISTLGLKKIVVYHETHMLYVKGIIKISDESTKRARHYVLNSDYNDLYVNMHLLE